MVFGGRESVGKFQYKGRESVGKSAKEGDESRAEQSNAAFGGCWLFCWVELDFGLRGEERRGETLVKRWLS
ncbi:hypothetical protein TorRG33x02_115640 [Trema orientale]|uniref:Uncharacterized protein n=1 Tax=Trema orientale TaxID=63057 RepID=A0A2P5F4K6_TREOI|nr:hypothetical protein TorRG33x02_115640 [Trema orientale]